MVTATTNRPKNARPSQSPRTSEKTPVAIETLNIHREVGFFADAIKLVWAAPNSNEPITEYRLQYRVVSGAPDTGWLDTSNPSQGNLPRYEFNNVPKSRRFAFRIQARNNSGWSQWSKPFSEVTSERTATKEKSETVQAGTTSRDNPRGDTPLSTTEASFERIPGIFTDAVIARWITPESTAGIVNGYEIEFRLHQGQNAREWTAPSQRHDGRNPSYRFNNVPKPPLNEFSLRVRAKNDAGWSSWSQEFPDTRQVIRESETYAKWHQKTRNRRR